MYIISRSVLDLSGLCSLYGLTDLYSPISSIYFLIVMVGSSLAPKWSKLVLFCGMDHQKSIFYWYLIPLLSEAVEASRCYFFENWLIKFKCPNLLNTLGTMIQDNYQSLYLSGPFTLARFNMRHPVSLQFLSVCSRLVCIYCSSISTWYPKDAYKGLSG